MFKSVFIIFGFLFLIGCNSGPILSDKRTGPACPDAYIIRDLSLQTIKDPDSGQLLAKTHFDRIKPRCRTADKRISIQLNPQITAQRFNAENPKEVKTSYFIALVDAKNQLVAKTIFSVTLQFDGTKRRVHELPTDSYDIELPENVDLNQTKIYAGFQVENHQWVENKTRYTRHHLAGTLP